MKRIIGVLMVFLFVFTVISGCTKQESKQETEEEVMETVEEKDMKLYINKEEITVTWADNEAVSALKKKAEEGEITVELSMYGGFEQVGSLGFSLPRNDVQTVTESGDIVLYNGNNIVLFYGSNSWSYTRLGKMEITSEEAEEYLSHGDVTITIKAE